MLSKSLLPECQRNSEHQFLLLMPSLNCGDSRLVVHHSSRNVGSICHIPYVPTGAEKNYLARKIVLNISTGKTHELCIETTCTFFKQIDNSCLLKCWPLAKSGTFPHFEAALSAIQNFKKNYFQGIHVFHLDVPV